MNKGKKLASDMKFYLDYSKYDKVNQRAETWEDSVTRVMDMHRNNPKFATAFQNERFTHLFEKAEQAYKDKKFLGSQRALQFGGEPIMKHNAKLYNCTGSYADRPRFFQEALYLLLCGCGVGFSVQKHHIDKLPDIAPRTKGTKTIIVEDSIEGWSDALGALMSSFFVGKVPFPEYRGYIVHFDYSLIRPKGAEISGGFKAPGPEGLRASMLKVEELINKALREGSRLKPIHAYDIIMHASDAVLSGGVRRSATICLFSLEDEEMMQAKTGNWRYENKQRERSNNSVVMVRDEITKEDFERILESTKQFGEPGFVFVDHRDVCFNPCVEISFWCYNDKGESGWQGCNLTEGNGDYCTSPEKFYEVCEVSAVLGTIQATYTEFGYLGKVSEEIFEREALLGCSFTGWMNNPKVMLNEEVMRKGAQIVKEINVEMAQILGINPAARATCVKPSGNSSVILGTASGCHAEKFEQGFRVIQMNKFSEIAKYLATNYPQIIEEGVYSRDETDYAVFCPVVNRSSSILNKDLMGVDFLEVVKKIQNAWVDEGTTVERCVKPFLRHNVSNTVTVADWEPIGDYLYENRMHFTAVSFMNDFGDKDWNQAPFTTVLKPEEIFEKYGEASFFASGLIIDGLHSFEGDFWKACDCVLDKEKAIKIDGTRIAVLVKKDWLRRAKQFAKRFFRGNLKEMTYCLKDIHLYHKWVKINREVMKDDIDFSKLDLKPEYIDVDTTGAVACAGGQCELPDYLLQ